MCIPMTPVLTLLYIVIIEVYLQCFTESIILRDIGKPTSRAEISIPSSLHFKAVKGAHLGLPWLVRPLSLQTLTVKRTHTKHTILSSKRNLEIVYIIF